MGGKHFWKNVLLLGNFFFFCERRTHEQKNSLLLHKYTYINKEDSYNSFLFFSALCINLDTHHRSTTTTTTDQKKDDGGGVLPSGELPEPGEAFFFFFTILYAR